MLNARQNNLNNLKQQSIVAQKQESNENNSEVIDDLESNNLIEELDAFNESIFCESVTNKELKTDPIISDLLNKSLRLINLKVFENSPTNSATQTGLHIEIKNKNTIIHTNEKFKKKNVRKQQNYETNKRR